MDSCVNRQLLLIEWGQFSYFLPNTGLSVEVKDGVGSLLHNELILHLPNGQRTSIEEALNPVFVILVVQLWPKFVVRHHFEDEMLSVPVNKVTLKFAIKQDLRLNMTQGCIIDVDFIDSITHALALSLEADLAFLNVCSLP